MTRVKICGLSTEVTVNAAVENGADYIGFVFAPSRRQISVERAQELAKLIPSTVKKVGVFVNEPLDSIEAIIKAVPLDIAQLHGDETPEYVKQLTIPVIKAFPICDGKIPTAINSYPGAIILLDAPPAEFVGGSGKIFDWAKVNPKVLAEHQFFIAGGLTPDNVQEAINFFQPYGVDVSSGVETNKQKDMRKIQQFIENAKMGENL
jgi:phosphoribosylanthranilate isomerase